MLAESDPNIDPLTLEELLLRRQIITNKKAPGPYDKQT
jgi:hypothetical protein